MQLPALTFFYHLKLRKAMLISICMFKTTSYFAKNMWHVAWHVKCNLQFRLEYFSPHCTPSSSNFDYSYFVWLLLGPFVNSLTVTFVLNWLTLPFPLLRSGTPFRWNYVWLNNNSIQIPLYLLLGHILFQ